jgi:hypothetical protein
MAAFIAAGTVLSLNNGFIERYPPDQQKLLTLAQEDYHKTLAVYSLGKCFLDYDQSLDTLLQEHCISSRGERRKIVVFGDSQAAHYIFGVREYFPEDQFSIDQWTAASCRPFATPNDSPTCREIRSYFITNILPTLTEQDTILVSANWANNFKGEDMSFIRSLDEVFAVLVGGKARAVVLGTTPAFSVNPYISMVKSKIAPVGPVFLKSADFSRADRIVSIEAEKYGLYYYRPAEIMCKKQDQLDCLVFDGKDFLFFDSGHLSTAGSSLVIGDLRKHIADQDIR